MKFKPKLRSIAEEYGMDLVILIPKNGGLKDTVSTTLNEMGVDYLAADKIDRDNFNDGVFKISLWRGEDIPKIIEDLYFEKGIKAIGFTGDDLFDEYKLNNPMTPVEVIETTEWIDESAKYMRPALCLLAPKGSQLKGKVKIAVNAKYEQTSRLALDEIKESLGIEPEIFVYNGNTELTVAQGITDAAVEIVYTGNSIERNGLEIIGKPIRCSDFVLIGINEKSPRGLWREFQIVGNRLKNPKEGSYTNKLASSNNGSIKKLGEEFSEFIQELVKYDSLQTISEKDENRKRIVEEFSDMLYVQIANAVMRGVNFDDIMKEKYRRMKRD